VSIALTSTLTYFYSSNREVMQSIAASNAARIASEEFVRNMREASQGNDGSYPVLAAASSSVTFFSNTDSDASAEKVRWFLESGTLYRGITKFSGTTYSKQPEKRDALFAFVQNTDAVPLFQYFDTEGAVIADPVDVNRIRSVKMDVIVGTSVATTSTFSLTSVATLRAFSL
jgi:hypothetical protein